MNDLLPAGVSLVSANPSQGSYDNTSGVWTVGTVSPGAAQTLSIIATVVSPAAQTNTGTITHADQFDPNTANNTASATETPPDGRHGQPRRPADAEHHWHGCQHHRADQHGDHPHADQFDPNTANNTASATETPQEADLVVAKQVSNPTPNPGDKIVYTVTVTDAGPDTATGVVVTDLLPAGVTFVSATPSQGSFDNITGLWNVGTIATAASATLAITASVVERGQRDQHGDHHARRPVRPEHRQQHRHCGHETRRRPTCC